VGLALLIGAAAFGALVVGPFRFAWTKRGWSTRAEGAALAEYGHAPDLAVLSWGVNDIEGAARGSSARRWPRSPAARSAS